MSTVPQKKRITLRDIARAAGVSVASVSLALRNSPKISDEMKERVGRVCRDLDYVKDGKLSELMAHLRKSRLSGPSSALGILISNPNREALEANEVMMECIKKKAKTEGYSVAVFDLTRKDLSPTRVRQIMDARGILGVVVLPSDDHSLIEGMDFEGLCVVALGYEFEIVGAHRVCPNYFKMMDELMRDILAKGYRRIAFVPEQSQRLLKNRMLWSSIEYYLSEVKEATRLPGYYNDLNDEAALEAWLRQQRPDVVLGSRKTWERLRALGYTESADFGFACWDVSGMDDQVSGLDPRVDLMAQEATRILVSQLHANKFGKPEHPETLIVDSSYQSGDSLRDRSNRSQLAAAV